MYVHDAGRLFDRAGHLVDQATREVLEAVLAGLDRWIRNQSGPAAPAPEPDMSMAMEAGEGSPPATMTPDGSTACGAPAREGYGLGRAGGAPGMGARSAEVESYRSCHRPRSAAWSRTSPSSPAFRRYWLTLAKRALFLLTSSTSQRAIK